MKHPLTSEEYLAEQKRRNRRIRSLGVSHITISTIGIIGAGVLLILDFIESQGDSGLWGFLVPAQALFAVLLVAGILEYRFGGKPVKPEPHLVSPKELPEDDPRMRLSLKKRKFLYYLIIFPSIILMISIFIYYSVTLVDEDSELLFVGVTIGTVIVGVPFIYYILNRVTGSMFRPIETKRENSDEEKKK